MNVTANFADVRVFWVSSVTEPAAVEALLMENISRIRKDMYEVSGELNVFILHYSALKCSLFRVGKVTQNSVRPGYQLSSHAEDGSVVPDVGAAARYPKQCICAALEIGQYSVQATWNTRIPRSLSGAWLLTP